jgi:signal-transduction protein with cAMP-binding, CBS, and nucleotidyltransferase domain
MSNISDYINSPVLTISHKSYARNAIEKMYENQVSALLVEENGKYVGVITKTDWIHMVLSEECDPNTIVVSTIMASPIVTVDKNKTMAQASVLMEEHNIRHLAITDQGSIVGMLSVKDLERYYCFLHDKEGVAQYGL